MPQSPRFSVVMPAYNYGRYVSAAIASVLAQTVPVHEVIVVDDGSTDDTQERVATFGDRVRYVRRANGGPAAARNAGLALASGDWVAFLDADDVWHPQKLERQVLALAAHPELRAISCLGVEFRTPAPEFSEPISGDPTCLAVDLEEQLLGTRFSGGSNAIVRRDCFAEIGNFDESLVGVEDIDMWLRLGAHYPIGRVLERLTYMRTHQVNLSSYPVRMEEHHRRALAKAFATLPALRGRRWLYRQALARLHREIAWMYMESRQPGAALGCLWRSFLACPLTSGRKRSWLRLRMVAHCCLPRPTANAT